MVDITNTKKLSAAGIGIPLGIVIVWAIGAVGQVTVPGEVGAAIGAIITWVASVLIPDDKEE